MRYPVYPKYKDSNVAWLGQVPEHWGVKRLKMSAHLTDRKVEAEEEKPVPYVGLENIESWTGKLLPINPDVIPTGVANQFSRNCTLFGKLRPYLAKACNPDFDGLCSTELLVIETEDFDRRALLYWLLADGFIKLVDSSTYGSKMPRANWDFIGNCLLPIPPLPEQTAIADFLDRETGRIDTLVAKKRALIGLLKEKRSALISRTVTRGLPGGVALEYGLEPHTQFKDSGIEWLGVVPERWEVKRLRFVGKAILGLTYDPGEVVDELEGTLVLRSSNVQGGKISLEDNVYVSSQIPNKLRTRIGDILICSRNGSRALIGKNAKINSLSAGVTFGAFMTIFRSQFSEFLYHVFNSPLFDFQSGAFLTSTINQLTVHNLYNFEVPFPPENEQLAIGIYLERETAKIDRLVAKVEAAIASLLEYRTALITAAVTGKIDIRQEVV